MSYLDDLKENQLLHESFYYVPGPDNLQKEEIALDTEVPLLGLTEEELLQTYDILFAEDGMKDLFESVDLELDEETLQEVDTTKLQQHLDFALKHLKRLKARQGRVPTEQIKKTQANVDNLQRRLDMVKQHGGPVEPKEATLKTGEKVAKWAAENPVSGAVTAAAVVAALSVAAIAAYRRFISKAGRACKDAPNKKECKAQYREKAKAAQKKVMQAGKAKCAQSKDPAKCKAKIDKKIAAL